MLLRRAYCSTSIEISIGLLNINYNELTESISATECSKHVLPVGDLINLASMPVEYIHYVYKRTYLINQYHWPNTSQQVTQSLGQNDKIILADGCNVERVTELIVVCVIAQV